MDQEISEYIKTALNQGQSKENIYKDLLARGLTLNAIEAGFVRPANNEEVRLEKEYTQKKTIRIILTIAAILVGVGIFSFIASNWKVMGNTLKVSLIITTMLVSYSLGWHLKEKLNYGKTGSALIYLGSVIFGSGIFLIGQMFNIRANWPDGFILWMFGVIAVAYVTDLFPMYYLVIILGVITIIGHPFGIFTSFGYDPFLLTSSLLLLVSTIVTFTSGLFIYKKIPKEFN